MVKKETTLAALGTILNALLTADRMLAVPIIDTCFDPRENSEGLREEMENFEMQLRRQRRVIGLSMQ